MEIAMDQEMIALLAVVSTVTIGFIKSIMGKKYIKGVSRVVPVMLALGVAVMSNYGLQDQLTSFVSTGGVAYGLSQAIYKIDKL